MPYIFVTWCHHIVREWAFRPERLLGRVSLAGSSHCDLFCHRKLQGALHRGDPFLFLFSGRVLVGRDPT